MRRAPILALVAILTAISTSCERSEPTQPVVVHVLRDPYFGADLVRTNIEFAKTEPHVRSGRPIVLDTRNDVPYWDVPKRFRTFAPDVFVVFSTNFEPSDPAIKAQLGNAQILCGVHPAFVLASTLGEEREAAEMYVSYTAQRCPPVANIADFQKAANVDAEADRPDPQRPPCTSSQCRKIKKFLKDHYCGESPFGNGPEDGCDYKTPASDAKLVAHYSCEWNESDGKSNCQQQGEPNQDQRKVLLDELHRLGLPARGEKEVHFTTVESPSGWSLVSADYDHIDGQDLTVCETVVAMGPNGILHVLRKVKLRKTNADVPEGTSWSPLDIADVDGDGQMEFVLKGDAYEDHWLEVVSIEGDSFKTIFSGLGYYL